MAGHLRLASASQERLGQLALHSSKMHEKPSHFAFGQITDVPWYTMQSTAVTKKWRQCVQNPTIKACHLWLSAALRQRTAVTEI